MPMTMTELNKSFVGATESELRGASAPQLMRGAFAQNTRFPHSGVISATQRMITFGDWASISPADITEVSRKFTPAYGRLAAAGVRGGFGSLGVFEHWGAPIIIQQRGKETLYVLVEFRNILGTTDNASWTKSLRSAFPDLPVLN